MNIRRAVLLVVVVCVFGTAGFGQPWDGSGTEGDPYLIYDACDMQAIGADANYWDAHFLLCADIDLGDYTGTQFSIIGSGGDPFTGVFDGDGHTISNFTYDSNGVNYIGIFGNVGDPNAEIKNLGLIDPRIDTGTGYAVGGLVGGFFDGTISNCYVEGGSVTGGTYVGGMAGANGADISNCYCTASVLGDIRVGGLLGENMGDGRMYNCYSTGVVSGGQNVGGLVGFNGGGVFTSYWDIESSGQSTSAGGRGKTTAEMKTASTFIGWGCGFVWTIDEGNDYPRLAWENRPGEIISNPSYGGGSGEPNDPYLIYTAEQLNIIGEIWCDLDKHFKLMSDIDLVGFLGTEFNIIGSAYFPFVGVFDGNGHTISNFSYVSTGKFRGFFPYVANNAEIRNLGLLNPNVDAGLGNNVGALIGYLHGGGTVNRCYVEGGTVRGRSDVGGLIGWNGWENGGGTITNCYSTAHVTGTGAFVGGLVGRNYGTLVHCYSMGSITGYNYVGGLAGANHGETYHCYSTGAVSGTGNSRLGGLIGNNNWGMVTDSFWNKDTSGRNNMCGEQCCGGTGCNNDYGKSTAEMQTENTFTDAGWDFTTPIWTICEGEDYPRLAWEKYGGGNGTEANPYLIRTSCQMNAIGANPNDWDAHFKLMGDIDLGKFSGTAYNLIGYYYYQGGWKMLPFTGTFDGNWQSIRNFMYHDRNRDGVGIFGYTGPDSEVKNVYVEDANAAGCYYVGSLVGMNEGTVSSCRATGVVLGEENVGGLVGMNEFGSVIKNCSADVAIEIKNDNYAFSVGGLVGYNFYGTVTNSFANGIIIGSTETYYTGGLAGFHRGGEIRGCYANVDVSGLWYIGGLIGQNEGAVNSCFSTGDVSCVFGGGGLIGRMWVGVVDCYATGNVNVEEYAGGLIGWDLAGGATNCYSIGAVSGTTGVGGLVGNTHHEDVVYQSCFWNTDNNPDVNGIGNVSDPNVIGESTANMQTASTFTDAGWDFVGESTNGTDDIWEICEGTNYPKFVWQIPAADFVCPDGVNFIDYAFFAEHWLQAIYGDCGGVELTGDGNVNWVDFALFAEYWMLTGCGECGGADFTGDGNVDLADLAVFAEHWLEFEYAEVDLTNDGQVDLDDLREFTDNWLAGL